MVPLIALSGEIPYIMRMTFLTHPKFWITMSVSALCGYLINIAFFLQIQYTSPLSNTISGTAKACVQTILGVFFFNEILSLLTWAGALICIFASAWYSKVRYDENEKAKQQANAAKV